MSKIIDITNKLDFEESPKLRIRDYEVEVNTDAPTVLKAVALFDGEVTPQKLQDLYMILFPDESREILDSLRLNFKSFRTVIQEAMAMITGVNPEDVSARES